MTSRKVTIHPKVLYTKLDEEMVLLNLINEQYYSLNEMGTTMWNALLETPSVDAALQSLLATYDVPIEELKSDLEAFLQSLIKANLVLVSEA